MGISGWSKSNVANPNEATRRRKTRMRVCKLKNPWFITDVGKSDNAGWSPTYSNSTRVLEPELLGWHNQGPPPRDAVALWLRNFRLEKELDKSSIWSLIFTHSFLPRVRQSSSTRSFWLPRDIDLLFPHHGLNEPSALSSAPGNAPSRLQDNTQCSRTGFWNRTQVAKWIHQHYSSSGRASGPSLYPFNTFAGHEQIFTAPPRHLHLLSSIHWRPDLRTGLRL